LYPNPVINAVNINIPDELGAQQYSIADLSGREVASGILNTGIKVINLDKLENGLYSIRLWKKDASRNRIAIMRLAVIQ
jgi:hypothetical protein